ncbi:Xylose import ATP-binding protein XylG [Pleomorphomonas sp. T1.2MG-36]|uniref:sugar ABC transporter ATP-binding protein n=1 Tax=Pleomorphomonas sp. T1.2MG-36 TaxID=3041167 RepID=UPI002477B90A|nr:sugar ABC transporter ATP-binding protein [Pleomorphomonas sp. T1.2MG-36]CAI9412706.1 Xylose import ATP-binding protein XylG [Pleomorphomonas sp. T1.2MG-36]
MSALERTDAPAVILRAEKMTRVFPGTIALEDVDFDVYERSVNVLIGENGAGKSTLMRILAGVDRATSGRILMGGEEVEFSSVLDAAQKGIGIVFQELNLCPNLTVTENIFLGRDMTKAGIHIDMARQRERAKELLARLEHDIDPDTLVDDLRIGEQQIVEIAKALADDVKVLIMDEPTSALSASEVEVLFRVIAELKKSGVAIIYISHRLEELVRIGDYFTVLRDGHFQASAPKGEATIPWIIRQMLGTSEFAKRQQREVKVGEAVLSVRDLKLPRVGGGYLVDDVSVDFRAGEIVGIYGLLGAGRSELFESLFGLRADARGTVTINGKAIDQLPVSRRIAAGLFLVPEDRQRDGLVQNLSVGRNLSLASLAKVTKLFTVQSGAERKAIDVLFRSLRIKAPSPDTPITSLSGGNQQKVVIGKSLMTEPRVLLLDEPTRGIDIGAKEEVFRTMRELADQGLAVVFATSDLKEVHAVSDRVLVMSQGRITADLPDHEATDEAIVLASTKGHAAPAPMSAQDHPAQDQ